MLKTFSDGTTTTSYTYDGNGNRIAKNVGSSHQYQFVNDTHGSLPQLLELKDITNNSQAYYVYGNDLLSSGSAAANTRVYYLYDGLGNIRANTDSSGSTTQSFSYDPYGSLVTGNNLNDFGYKGQTTDAESALSYLQARYYDPSTGTFLSRDPVAGVLGDPQTQNGYSYTNNNPVNLSDPSGQFVGLIIAGLLVAWSVYDTYHDISTCNYANLPFDALSFFPIGRTEKIGIVGLKITDHAAESLAERNISKVAVEQAVNKGEKFNYYHDNQWKVGYFDPQTNTFVGTAGGNITTVIQGSRVNSNYINNLKSARP